jgi:hypothetical protein
MAEHYKFEMHNWRSPMCMACEEMLADALDETLGEADRTWFDRHVSTCTGCSQRLADAQRGAAWLEMLKSPRPEPSAQLMERILAQTSDAQTSEAPAFLPSIPQPQPARILPFRIPLPRFNTWLEPRLAMTAAMAFFSVALTLNLSGVKLNELHASDLKPENLKRTYFQANAQFSRYYDNLRVVRVMESRVEDLREANFSADPEPQQPAGPQAQPQQPETQQPARQPARQPTQQATPQPDDNPATPQNPGMSRRENPLAAPRLLYADDKLRRGTTAAALNPKHPEGGLA